MEEFDQFWEENFPQDAAMTEEQKWGIADLLEQVTLPDNELNGVKLMLAQSPSAHDAQKLIGYLYSRLPHPVTERGRYSQTDLNKHLKQVCNNVD